MKTVYNNIRLVFSGDSVMLVISIFVFLASLANATQWQILRPYRFCGICTMLISLTFFLLTGLETLKPDRLKRTIVSSLLFLAATLICLRGVHFFIERGP
jgi:hypothetical protein